MQKTTARPQVSIPKLELNAYVAGKRGIPKQADVVFIVGPGQDAALLEDVRRECAAGGLEAVFVGNTRSEVHKGDIASLVEMGKLGPNTHVFILAHGNKNHARPDQGGGTFHAPTLSTWGDLASTAGVAALLRAPIGDEPGWNGPLHVLSCYGGDLVDEIEPGSDLWNAGPLLLYEGRNPSLMGLPDEDLVGSVRFLAECKRQGAPVTGMEAFGHLSNWTGERISLLGPEVEQPLTLTTPREPADLEPDALHAAWVRTQAEQKLDSRVEGRAEDLKKAAEAAHPLREKALDSKARNLKAVHIQADRGTPESLLKLLDKYPDQLDGADPIGRTPLHRACIHGNIQTAEALLTRGANIEHRDSRDRSTLGVALDLAQPNAGLVKLLCRHGFDPNQPAIAGHRADYTFFNYTNSPELRRAMQEGWAEYLASRDAAQT